MEQLKIPEICFEPFGEVAAAIAKEAHERLKTEHDCICWLMGEHGCGIGVIPYVERLFREFGRVEAWDRANALSHLEHSDGWSLEDAEYIGIYDHTISDYHVLWDRSWAISMLVPKELVPKVWKCGYGGKPKFWDREGNLLFQSVYSVDGHVLTRDERREALEGR